MIGAEAGRALDLIQGIKVCKVPGEGFWESAFARVLLDLDEAGAHEQVKLVADLLAGWWATLPNAAPTAPVNEAKQPPR